MSNVIPIKEKLKFTDLFDNHKVKQIAWGEDFLAWPIEKQVDYAKKLASAMNEAAAEMQKDRDRHFDARILAEKQRDEAEAASAIAKDTMVKSVMDSNMKTRELEDEILKLLTRLKAYE